MKPESARRLLNPDIRLRLRAILDRLREIRETQAVAAKTARSSIHLADTPVAVPFQAAIDCLRRDLDSMAVVALNQATALLDDNDPLAESAEIVSSILDKRIERGLTLLDGFLDCVS